jgi:hypothetical protein
MTHIRRMCIPCLLLGIAILIFPAAAAEVVFSWATPNFTPCEGVGIHGSYRVTARANISTDGSGNKIMDQLTVFASSAAFSSDNNSSITVGLDVINTPAPTQSFSLVTQPPNSIAESPGPSETPRLFLPPNTSIKILPNTTLVFNVSATIQTSSGSCAVGSTTKEIDPNQPPDSPRNRRNASKPKARR